MNELVKIYFPILFPISFVCGWLFVTILLGQLSGWYDLMRRYPDKAETPLLQLRNLSGMMGIVSIGRILKIAVCPSGLRIGIMKIFGVFSRDFFVPWQEIKVVRKDRFFWQSAVLRFGEIGTLSIPAYVADKLARSAEGHWPEMGTVPQATNWQTFKAVAKLWFLSTTCAATFFTVVPRIMLPKGADSAYPPVSVAILFPATVFGIVYLIQYFQRIKRR